MAGMGRSVSVCAVLLAVAAHGAVCGATEKPAPPAPPPGTADSALPEATRQEIAALREQVARSPEDDELRRRLAIRCHAALLREESVEQFEILARRKPEDSRALLDLALAYGSAGRMEESAATYERLLKVVPGHAVALHNLGNLALKRGDAPAAVAWYRKAIDSKADYLLAWHHLGDALKLGERFTDAYRAYEKALELEPRTPEELEAYHDSLYKLASLDLAMGAVDRAGAMLEELLRAEPEHGSGYYAYGQVLLRLGRPDDARRAFERHASIQARKTPSSPMAADE
jgi:tetratricopeptide (TPR) repeat protein